MKADIAVGVQFRNSSWHYMHTLVRVSADANRKMTKSQPLDTRAQNMDGKGLWELANCPVSKNSVIHAI